jgi:hypothetical protein
MQKVQTFDVQATELEASYEKAFKYIADPANLSQWTLGLTEADDTTALIKRPEGKIKIGFSTKANFELGTIGWQMSMPNGSTAIAYSRLMKLANGNVMYSFTFSVDPSTTEKVQEHVETQAKVITQELSNLRTLLAAK